MTTRQETDEYLEKVSHASRVPSQLLKIPISCVDCRETTRASHSDILVKGIKILGVNPGQD